MAVGRTSIELRQIQLPPAPDDDLPDMVRFQAAREFNELDERWLLDFVPIDETPTGPRTVLATAIAPAMIQQIEAVCQQAGVKMRRLLLRPCEAASLLAGDKSVTPEQVRLLIDLLADEADLTAVIDGKAVFLRTTRFGGDPPPLPTLLAEIRLTMAAVQNQLGGRQVQSIVLAGQENTHADLAQHIETELGMHVHLFDPFAAVELVPALKNSPPANPDRFATLLGMLLTESRQTKHAIDFLHPRRRAEAPSRRKMWVLAGTAIAVLGLAYLVYARIDSFLLASEVDDLTTQSRLLEPEVVKAKKVIAAAAEIAKWADAEVIWLDQLRGLCEVFPAAKDAVLTELTFDVTTATGRTSNGHEGTGSRRPGRHGDAKTRSRQRRPVDSPPQHFQRSTRQPLSVVVRHSDASEGGAKTMKLQRPRDPARLPPWADSCSWRLSIFCLWPVIVDPWPD